MVEVIINGQKKDQINYNQYLDIVYRSFFEKGNKLTKVGSKVIRIKNDNLTKEFNFIES